MINKIGKNKAFLFLMIILFLSTGCSLSNKLKNMDDRVGEFFKEVEGEKKESEKNDIIEEIKNINYTELTRQQKEKIDKWLDENNFNRYGDNIGTMYAGGTPLFNEMTGEARDRYEYILEKMPSIIQKIENIK